MLDTLTMWLIGLPYALYQTQRIKVGADRFLEKEPWYIREICDHLKRNGVSVVITQQRHDFDVATSILRGPDHIWN